MKAVITLAWMKMLRTAVHFNQLFYESHIVRSATHFFSLSPADTADADMIDSTATFVWNLCWMPHVDNSMHGENNF